MDGIELEPLGGEKMDKDKDKDNEKQTNGVTFGKYYKYVITFYYSNFEEIEKDILNSLQGFLNIQTDLNTFLVKTQKTQFLSKSLIRVWRFIYLLIFHTFP